MIMHQQMLVYINLAHLLITSNNINQRKKLPVLT